MQWTMPRRTLQIVAVLIGLAAIGSFAMGVINAPQRGRLPGERVAGARSSAAPVAAVEATPLSQERIEGPPPPPQLTPEEKARQDAEKKAKAETDAAAKAEATAAATSPPPAKPPAPAADRAGDLPAAAAPPEEPPH